MLTALSRRNFFKYMLAIGAIRFGTVPLYAKVTKIAVKYQQVSTTGKKCKECANFIPEKNECKLVEGKISPDGWCKFYQKKG